MKVLGDQRHTDHTGSMDIPWTESVLFWLLSSRNQFTPEQLYSAEYIGAIAVVIPYLSSHTGPDIPLES